jgi:hypothetical protein
METIASLPISRQSGRRHWRSGTSESTAALASLFSIWGSLRCRARTGGWPATVEPYALVDELADEGRGGAQLEADPPVPI